MPKPKTWIHDRRTQFTHTRAQVPGGASFGKASQSTLPCPGAHARTHALTQAQGRRFQTRYIDAFRIEEVEGAFVKFILRCKLHIFFRIYEQKSASTAKQFFTYGIIGTVEKSPSRFQPAPQSAVARRHRCMRGYVSGRVLR